MATIVTRAAKGSPLTHDEVDANFTNLNNDKAEAANYVALAGDTMTGPLVLSADPASSLQAATKQYVDTIASAGIHYHDPVRVETPSALTAAYSNGASGVGATLTNSGAQAAIVIDGVTLSSADRVLVYNQASAAQNGVYTVTTVGSASTNWVLTRAADADSYAPSSPTALGQGDAFYVSQGSTGAGELYVCTTVGTITFGTTGIVFSQIAATAVYSAGTGLALTGTVFSNTITNNNQLTNGSAYITSSASISGNAATATTAAACTGNALTATTLQTARTIGGVSFDGSINVNLPGVNATGNQNTSGSAASCTGNAATATALQTARTIGGVAFDGTAAINLPGVNTGGNQNTSGNAATATNATTAASCSGNAATATALQTARTINTVSFDGTANISLSLANLGFTGASNANYITNNNQITNGAGYTTYTSNQATNTSSSVTFSSVTAATINTTSDIRLKDNIRTFESAMDVVSQLRGVRFAWKETGVETVGLIAQEVEKVLPELIGTNADTGLKSVSYANMVAVLIEAVKELKAEIEELKKR
jgi:hypothetical protein